MLYEIANKYYIRVAPMKYTEVKFELKHNDVVIKVTSNRIIATGDMNIKEINFQKEKENIKNTLCGDGNTQKTMNQSSKHRRRG